MKWGLCLLWFGWAATAAVAESGAFVRFKLLEPSGTAFRVQLGSYIHVEPWYLPRAEASTNWFDLKAYAGAKLHGRLRRSGGVGEFPCLTARFITDRPSPTLKILIELATAPDDKYVVKRFRETLTGDSTGFLVSPHLAADKDSLETVSEMRARRLSWARTATGGKRVAPTDLIVQTSFWTGNLTDAEVLWLLGFNVVGNQTAAIHEKFPGLRIPGHTHNVDFGPAATREQIDADMKKLAEKNQRLVAGVPFGFSDEICARPPIGNNPTALEHFRAWLGQPDAVPIETPENLDSPERRRMFYHTSRFRQLAGSERIKWMTESFHKYFPPGLLTTTLVADHPYFGGTGLGMGMKQPNTTWGGWPLALDWFDMARRKVVDLAGIEDWMGLQYMYGPNSTWEGFQLMGFQAAIFRSGSRGTLPIIAWITPSDETNLRLKSSSALCQGAKHFFYWTYGPTETSTENYWSDLRSAYDGIVHMTRQLAAAEHIIAPGTMRKTRVALLYSISSDLWQPVGYIHMLERRATYLALVHNQYAVDMLTEEDITAGRLSDYDVLCATDPCLTDGAVAAIEQWVKNGGYLYGSCGAGSRNEFDEPGPGLAKVFGIEPGIRVEVQPGEYRIRGSLNSLQYIDEVQLEETTTFGVLGVKVTCKLTSGEVLGRFRDGSPAAIKNTFGKGRAIYYAACPGLSYLKDAKFAPAELKEQYPATQRWMINDLAAKRGVPRVVELSHPVVEAGLYDAPGGTALVLANFTYQPIEKLIVRLPVDKPVKSVRSVERGRLRFTRDDSVVEFTLRLGLNDIVLVE